MLRARLSLAIALSSAALAQSPLTTVRVVEGLDLPTFATAPPNDPRLFVTEFDGLVRVVENGALLAMPYLDVEAASGNGVSQFYSIAFHPEYALNGYSYIYYRADAGGGFIERYTVSANANVADPASRVVIMQPPLPAPAHSGHGPVFGPDGMLYIALGDGTGGADLPCNGQNPATLFGSILRIDVDGGSPYAVPPDNPFVNTPGYLPEIWALGFRNPWQLSFDRATGELYVADIGESEREEINVVVAGGNHGWSVEEGSLPFAHSCPPGTPPFGDSAYTRPIHEYDHSLGACSVTGGYVYRGSALPGLQGTYFFGDYCGDGATYGLWSLRYANGVVSEYTNRTLELQPNIGGPLDIVVSFAEDADGELYAIDYSEGALYKIVADCGARTYCTSNPNSTGNAARVSATGSASIATNGLILRTLDVPPNRFGYYVMSTLRDAVPLAGSQGTLCVGVPFYRFAAHILDSGPAGALVFTPDQAGLPQGVTIQPGETWHFQSWFRDDNPGPTSNTSDGVSVTFCP